MSFVGSDSSGSGRERHKSKHRKDRRDRDRDRRRETDDKPGRENSTFLFTSVDVVSPSGQTVGVSVEGIPPSTIPDVVCPLAKGVADPAVSAPDASRLPLTNTDSAALQAGRNLEVF
jgi:hypothetical protein